MRALYPQAQRWVGQTQISTENPQPNGPPSAISASCTQDTQQLTPHFICAPTRHQQNPKERSEEGEHILFPATIPGATAPASDTPRCGSIVSPLEGAEPDALVGADTPGAGGASNVRNGVGATSERWKRARNSFVGGPSGKGCCCCCGSCATVRSTTGYGGGPGMLGERPALMACSA